MVRKELREHIFKMLFQIEFNDPQEMPEQIEYYFSTLEDAADKDKEYINYCCPCHKIQFAILLLAN